jgi:hypothetical protein
MARFVKKMRGPVSFVEVGVKTAPNDADDTTPRLTSGAGVPTTTQPPGSLYMRTDAPGIDVGLYVFLAGGAGWTAIDGSP